MREWLISRRKSNNMTQKYIADIVGIDRAHYANIENGQRRPSVEVAKKIAKLLEFDWQLFYPDEENSA